MGDKVIYVFTYRRRVWVVESMEEIPKCVTSVEVYTLDKILTRGNWREA